MEKYKLSELIVIKNGRDHKDLPNGDYPVFGSGGIMRYVNSYLYDKPSVLLPRKGSLSNIQYSDTPFWTVDTLYYTEINEELVSPYYLYRYLRLLDMSRLDSGTGVPSMTFDSYYNINVFLPNIEEQRRVASILQKIDAKIALNHQINDNLEAMARQLYDYWFVQFDFPNEDGKPYKSSGGAMVWNEKLKREIPEEWKAANVFDELSVQYGFPFSTELFTEEPTNIPVVRIRDILENSVSAYSEEEVDEKYKLQKQDLLVGMDGNFHMNYWNDNVSYLNQRSVRLRAKSKSAVSIMQAKYDIAPYIKAKELRAKGSTVGHLSDKDLKELFVLVSPNADFRNKFDYILAEIIENRCEMIELTKQRDELLPLLMNGQASVNYHLSVFYAKHNQLYLCLKNSLLCPIH